MSGRYPSLAVAERHSRAVTHPLFLLPNSKHTHTKTKISSLPTLPIPLTPHKKKQKSKQFHNNYLYPLLRKCYRICGCVKWSKFMIFFRCKILRKKVPGCKIQFDIQVSPAWGFQILYHCWGIWTSAFLFSRQVVQTKHGKLVIDEQDAC